MLHLTRVSEALEKMLGLSLFKSNHSPRMVGLICLNEMLTIGFKPFLKKHPKVCVWQVLNKFHFFSSSVETQNKERKPSVKGENRCFIKSFPFYLTVNEVYEFIDAIPKQQKSICWAPVVLCQVIVSLIFSTAHPIKV